MNTTVGTTKRASSLKRPTLGVGPGCAQSAKAIAGTVAPKNESRADWRGANGKPPIAVTMAIIGALKKMRTMKMRRMSFIPLMIRWPSRKAKGSGCEGVLHEDEVADAAGGLAAALHGHGDVGLLEGDDVVDAVADHGHVAPAVAQGLDEVLLLLGRDAAEDAGLVGRGGELLGRDARRARRRRRRRARGVGAGAAAAASPGGRPRRAGSRAPSPSPLDHVAVRVHALAAPQRLHAGLRGEGDHRLGVVAGDDLDVDAGLGELLERLRTPGRSSSLKQMRASASRPSGRTGGASGSSLKASGSARPANSTTRRPRAAHSSALRAPVGAGARAPAPASRARRARTCRAPRRRRRRGRSTCGRTRRRPRAPPSRARRGTRCAAPRSSGWRRWCWRRRRRAGALRAPSSAPSAASSSNVTTPEVSVPVLSVQSTSTLLRLSTALNCCTSTSLPSSRTAPSA